MQYLSHVSHALSHLLHLSHAIFHLLHLSHAINAISHLSHRYFIQHPFLTHLLSHGGGGGHHRQNDDDNGYRCGHNRGGYNAAGEGGGGGGIVGWVIEGMRQRRPSPRTSPSLTLAVVVDVGHRRGRRLVGHRR